MTGVTNVAGVMAAPRAAAACHAMAARQAAAIERMLNIMAFSLRSELCGTATPAAKHDRAADDEQRKAAGFGQVIIGDHVGRHEQAVFGLIGNAPTTPTVLTALTS